MKNNLYDIRLVAEASQSRVCLHHLFCSQVMSYLQCMFSVLGFKLASSFISLSFSRVQNNL